MKNIYTSIIVCLTLQMSFAQNLLTSNTGYETNTNGWNLATYNGASGSLSRTTTESYSGAASAKLEVTASNGAVGDAQFVASNTNIIAIKSGKTYELRFWAKSNTSRTNSLEIGVAQPSPYIDIGGSTSFSTTSTWTEYVHTFTADADYAQARITILCGSFIATYHFDDFVLSEMASQSQTSYYVSNTGNDSNAGTISSPFKTIQKAVDVMQPGDEALITPGIYRETITTVRSGNSSSPITLKALSGGDVIITATEPVTGWTVHRGTIYKAPLNQQAYQLFVLPNSGYDFSAEPSLSPDELMIQARYPNFGTTRAGIFEAPEDGNFTAMTKSENTLTVTGLPFGDYTGASVLAAFETSNKRWFQGTLGVTSNNGNVLTGDFSSWLTNNTTGYVSGPLQLLDTQKEWSSDRTNLYFQAPSNQNPNNLKVEAKVRGLVLKINHDHIIVDGIKTFGGAISIGTEANNNTLTNLDIRYASNPKIWLNNYSVTLLDIPAAGITISGDNNIFSNSVLYYTAGEALNVASSGANNVIENNVIHYANYYGYRQYPIMVNGDDTTIIGNDVQHAGKGIIRVSPSAQRYKILYNNFANNGYICHDLGIFSTWGSDAEGGEIAYNWIHDNETSSIASNNHGIYLDNDNKAILMHHNVIWNIRGNNIRFNSPQYDMYVYNNSLGNSDQNIGDGAYFNPGLGLPDEMVNCNFKNNYMHRDITFDTAKYPNIIKSNNVINTDVSVFTNPSFMITSSSPAVDKGTNLSSVVFSGGTTYPSVTEFVTDGTPDAGAYEAGGVQWIPGINRVEINGGGPSLSINTNTLINESSSEKINLFPNPAKDLVTMLLPKNNLIHSIEVFDLNGRSVFKKNNIKNRNEFQLEVSALHSGTYIVKIINAKSVLTEKITIQ